jgi:diguanylate cyclase (GGDEF)-like protein
MVGELASVAASLAAHASNDAHVGSLVIVVHPDDRDHKVLAGGDSGVLRAAVSVAVASGIDRLWDGTPDGTTIERPIRSLPEIVRAAAEGAGALAVHIGAVRIDDAVQAVALWFETSDGVTPVGDRRNTIEILTAAAERERARLLDAARSAPQHDAANSVEAGAADPATPGGAAGPRSFDPDDPDLDAATGLATRERFTEALEAFESDQAALVVIDIDGFAEIEDSYGSEVSDRILRIVADRMVLTCRTTDLLARVGRHQFAVLFGDPERAASVNASKRLLSAIAAPLELPEGPTAVTATIAFAHQHGMVDTEELLESADDAITGAQRSGHGRLVLAA